MAKATLSGWYRSKAWDEPEYPPMVSEILMGKGFLDETLDRMDDLEGQGEFIGFDMGDLISYASRLDEDYRSAAREERRQKAAQRLCRIIAGMYTRAVVEGDVDECERLANALVLATRTWSYG